MPFPGPPIFTNRSRNVYWPFLPNVDAFCKPNTPNPGPPVVNMDQSDTTLLTEQGMTGAFPTAATVTIGGGPVATTAQPFTITVATIATTVTIAVGQTATQAAASLAAAINTNPAINDIVIATSAAGVVTISAINPSPALNGLLPTSLAGAGGGATPLTAGAITAFGVNGTGPVFPLETFALTNGAVRTITLRAGHPALLSGAFLTAVQKTIAVDGRRVI